MVKKYSDIRHVEIDGFKGGAGILTKVPSIEPGEFTENADVISKLILPPGVTIGYHQHVGNGEVITVLAGEGKYTEDGKEYIVHAGDVTICNDGHWHGFVNLSETEDLALFAVVIRS